MNLAWCVSGRGMAARAVVEAAEAGIVNSTPHPIIIDRPSPISGYCSAHNIRCIEISVKTLNRELISAQREYEIDWLALTFNRLISADAISAFQHQVFNLHMSLLPKYPGFEPIEKALKSGDEETGITVHIVDSGMDTGPIIAQARCDILPGDTVATLGLRQFKIAVPVLLQTVRLIESRQLYVARGEPQWNGGSTFAIEREVKEFSDFWLAAL